MFGLFKKNPLDKLEQEYARKLEAARNAQREGRMLLFAELSAAAEDIRLKLETLESR